MNVKLIRLQTGEDLIGDVLTNENNQLVIENPCMVYVRPNSTGTGASIGLTRWMPYAEGKIFTIDSRWVVILTDAEADLKNEYNKAFGSGIVVAPASLKVN
jgi:hypothetical protein